MKQTENIISEQIITGGGHHQIDLISIIIRINREENMKSEEDQGRKTESTWEETWKTRRKT